MKVVLLSTAPAETPASFARLREQLGLDEAYAAELVLITWHRPRAALPVDTALLVGPPAALSGRAESLAVSPGSAPGPASAAGAGDSEVPATTESGASATAAQPGARGGRGVVGTLRRVATKIAPGVLGSRFALACLRKPEVRDVIAVADVVVALDVQTYRLGWLLARRHEHPAFVAGTGAGRRVIAERAASPA